MPRQARRLVMGKGKASPPSWGLGKGKASPPYGGGGKQRQTRPLAGNKRGTPARLVMEKYKPAMRWGKG